MTNGDRIRQMSNEELAEILSGNCTYCAFKEDDDCGFIGTIYFKTEEDAQYIIDNYKEELMEYFL